MAPDYAIISLGGKQYVVKEGEKLLVDRLDGEEGGTFQPDVLFVGGDGGGELSPSLTVTAKVVGHERGPKIRIGKYRPKSGYRKHTGFRAALTRIEITGIGGEGRPAEASEPESAPAEVEEAAPAGLRDDYASMTVAQIAADAKTWDHEAVEAALAYEQEHAGRKGALAALETALEHEDAGNEDDTDTEADEEGAE
jgi:large subunit ribosomal protein L21